MVFDASGQNPRRGGINGDPHFRTYGPGVSIIPLQVRILSVPKERSLRKMICWCCGNVDIRENMHTGGCGFCAGGLSPTLFHDEWSNGHGLSLRKIPPGGGGDFGSNPGSSTAGSMFEQTRNNARSSLKHRVSKWIIGLSDMLSAF